MLFLIHFASCLCFRRFLTFDRVSLQPSTPPIVGDPCAFSVLLTPSTLGSSFHHVSRVSSSPMVIRKVTLSRARKKVL